MPLQAATKLERMPPPGQSDQAGAATTSTPTPDKESAVNATTETANSKNTRSGSPSTNTNTVATARPETISGTALSGTATKAPAAEERDKAGTSAKTSDEPAGESGSTGSGFGILAALAGVVGIAIRLLTQRYRN